MSNKLKIYMCSGVGGADQGVQFTTEGTNAATNTQAMNKLLSLINMCAADSQLNGVSQADRIKCYQCMDLYSVCFYFAQLYRDDDTKLTESGYAINQFVSDKKFDLTSTDLQEHGARVDEIINGVQALIDDGDYTTTNSSFIKWWKEDIIPYNKCGLSQEQQRKARAFRKQSVSGWEDNADLNKYLNDGGTYFIYTYFTQEQLRQLPVVFTRKHNKQMEVYNYCKQIFVPIYGTEADMRRIIANSIKFKFKMSPEELRDRIVNGDDQGVGDVVTIVVTVIITLIKLLIALLPVILEYCASIAVAKYTVPEDPSAGIATDEDFADWSPKKKEGIWLWLLAGAAALLLLSKD